MRISNYTINIANLKKIKDPEKEYSLCIRGKYGQTKLGEKTFGIKVAGKAWNSNKREIKPEYEKDYPVEV